MSGPLQSATLLGLGAETLAAVLESFQDACTLSRAVRDASGRALDMTLLWMNGRARAGQPNPDAAIGRTCTTLWPAMVANGSFAACLRVLDSGIAERGEFDWTARDTYRGGYYDWSATRVGDDLLLWVLRDASDRFRRTLESESRLNGILAAAPDAVLVIDEDGTITLANDACARLLGWSPSELVGERIEVLMPEAEAAEHGAWLQRYFATGERHIIGIGRDINARHREGHTVAARLSVSETTLFGRRVFTGMLHDLSARTQLEQQLRHAQKMEVVGRLVATVSHDFNNLLTIMTAASALLEPLVPGPPGNELVREIADASQRGAALTQHLLSLARPRPTTLRVFDPATVVRRLECSALRLVGRDIEVRVDVDDAGSGTVRADEGTLEQAILNLVVNARDAMPQGGRLTVSVQAVDADARTPGVLWPGRWIRLAVADTGTGMTPDVQRRALEPFFTTKPEGRGTGLGLSSVNDLANRLGGTVTIDSTPGEGTTVAMFLPCAGESAEVPVARDLSFRGEEVVLLVDDDEAIRRLMERALATKGYDVHVAANAGDALVRAATLPRLDVVVTDIVMPDADGLSLARRLLADHPDLRVLLVSGFAPEFDVRQLPPRTAFLAKPFSARDLGIRLQELVRTTTSA
ncbi:hybrid sensor histidine kinase/response regulator [Luteitalea sp.]